DLVVAIDVLLTDEGAHVAVAGINVPKTPDDVLEATQKSALLVEPGEAGHDHPTGLGGGDPVRLQDVSEVVHSPDRLAPVVDQLLADEVALAEVAIVIDPVPLVILQVLRSQAIGKELLPAADVGRPFGSDDESFQVTKLGEVHKFSNAIRVLRQQHYAVNLWARPAWAMSVDAEKSGVRADACLGPRSTRSQSTRGNRSRPLPSRNYLNSR